MVQFVLAREGNVQLATPKQKASCKHLTGRSGSDRAIKCNNYKSLFSLIRLPKPRYFGGSFKLECVITANVKFGPEIVMEQSSHCR